MKVVEGGPNWPCDVL